MTESAEDKAFRLKQAKEKAEYEKKKEQRENDAAIEALDAEYLERLAKLKGKKPKKTKVKKAKPKKPKKAKPKKTKTKKTKKKREPLTIKELEDLKHSYHHCKICKKKFCPRIERLKKKDLAETPEQPVELPYEDSDLKGLTDSERDDVVNRSNRLAKNHARKSYDKKGKLINTLTPAGQKRHDNGMAPYGGFYMWCPHEKESRLKAMDEGDYGGIRDFDAKQSRPAGKSSLEERILNYANVSEERINTFEKYPMWSRRTFSTFKDSKDREHWIEAELKKDNKKDAKKFRPMTMFDIAIQLMGNDQQPVDPDGDIKPSPPDIDIVIDGETHSLEDYEKMEKEKRDAWWNSLTDKEKDDYMKGVKK